MTDLNELDRLDEMEDMDVPETNNKKEVKIQLGDLVQVKRGPHKGTKGKVVVIRENSVIIEMGKNPKTNEPIRTVVNHKNYKKVR